ncbi:MAG: radical SAM protein [bacterium]|nr:radical SAM protein [bacterium]
MEIQNEYAKIIPYFQTQIESQYEQKDIHNKAKYDTTAYIPISTGCNQFCSFCIVPYARGLEKYFSVKQIIQEVQTHLDRGAQEIILLGQIVNKHPEFTTIIQEILKLPKLKRLRYTSPYPSYYKPELFQLHAQEPKLCPHIHIPLQSGSNTVLKRMFR